MKKHKALGIKSAICLMAMLLSGCAKSGNASPFSPIYISKDDQLTDPTARQILQHNELGRDLHLW